mmetsp:Transcript_52341/g.164394  ORF Transcript_52341/g.164394 Transcript_52341/m.164394 type:complete len:469 (-) Transcript_52341:418-1824(-)
MDDQAKLRSVPAMSLEQAANAHHQRRHAFTLEALGGDEGHLAVVVDEGQPRQPLVRGAALSELHDTGHAPGMLAVLVRPQALVELLEKQLVLCADRADTQPVAAARGPLVHILRRVRADGWLRQGRPVGAQVVQHHACVKGKDPLRRCQQWVDVHLLDPGLLHDNLAEAHHQLLHLRQVHLTPATDASQRRVDLRLLHHAAGERGRQRRQAERAVLVNLDQGAALAEEEYRSELLVHAAPDDDLVAAHPLHRLDADAVEVLRAGLLADAGLYSAEALADGVGIGDVEQHPADVGLVRYGLAVDLEHDGVAHPLGNSHGLVCRLGDLDRRHWDVVGRQHLLGLGLRQDSTLLSQGTLYDGPDALSVGSVLVVVFGQVRGLVKCLQAVLVTPHVVEQPHCGIRVVKRGDVRPVEDLLASPDCHAPHPACEQGLAAQVCVALELLRGHRWVCHVLWSQDDQQSVTVLVGGG